MSTGYFEQVFPTYIENWNPALYLLSIPQVDIPLSRQDTIDLGTNLSLYGASFGVPAQPILDIKGKISTALKSFPLGAFVRLGSRSGKDSLYAQHNSLKVIHSSAAIKILTAASERIAYDIRLALNAGYTPHIFVRQWVDIPEWAEFRCFMQSRKLVGISQYDCRNLRECPEVIKNAEKIEKAIRKFFNDFEKLVHLNDVVFDVFITKQGYEIGEWIDVTLLELNPFFDRTDACLFDWHRNDFDSSFRFIGGD